jgi:broad specificity phosphatase PhoE
MRDQVPDGESLEDFVSRISDVLRFVFAKQRDDIVVFVGEGGGNRELLPQLERPTGASPSTPAAKGDRTGEIVSGRTRIRRINEKLLVVL